ncbi:MAG: integrin alpha, partial [Chloroflexota bacterium]
AATPQPAWEVTGNQANALLGWSVNTADDVNGDGFADVIVGATYYSDDNVDEGHAFVYHGSLAGLSQSPDWTADGDQASAYFGAAVSGVGDVNGDGYDDVIVGADFYDGGQTDEGGTYVYHGSAVGLSNDPAWAAQGEQAAAFFGGAAGPAGDVNGDGYADVIVGARGYSNGQTEEGRAYVYYGSAAGLSPNPDWMMESDQAHARFGAAVGPAGDVNDDGFDDVVVGAWAFDDGQSDEGRAFVYLGSATGLSLTPHWMAESDQINARFGFAVNTAGDVNGDGYDDLLVGAPRYDDGLIDQGRVYLYLGSPSGVAAVPAWIVSGSVAGADWGSAVSTAGDADGDGYDDVIIGADWYSHDETQEGAAFIYNGSPAGLGLAPNWVIESDQEGAWLGFALGAAGDVNGDDLADVIVGAILFDDGQMDEGWAAVYLGHPLFRHYFPLVRR